SHAVGSRVAKAVEARAASADHKGLWAIRVGPACGVLRCEALIDMIVTLQNNIDVLGNQEINPRSDTGFRAMLGSAGEVWLVPVRDRTMIRVDVEVLLQPGSDVADIASNGSATCIW